MHVEHVAVMFLGCVFECRQNHRRPVLFDEVAKVRIDCALAVPLLMVPSLAAITCMASRRDGNCVTVPITSDRRCLLSVPPV